MADLDAATEAEIIALLGGGVLAGSVRRVDTHGARLFIGRDETLKIKRPVNLAYMDFSTRAKRQAACRRELEINATFAPDLYLGVDRITRETDGRLALNGGGELLELAVRMRTFPADAGLDAIAARGPLPRPLVEQLGDRIAALHATAPPVAADAGRPLSEVRARLIASAETRRDELGSAAVNALIAATQRQLERSAPVLDARRAQGATRRCHGDLHLGNIVLWRGRPTPFDAIEFDEDLASIDPIYDLAFLLMDLVHGGQSVAASVLLARYLWRRGPAAVADATWAALIALPLTMALRALVRAVVAVDRGRAGGGGPAAPAFADARGYLALATTLANPPPARLIAVGGLSGTGKSTLAAALAPGLGAAPGAIHLRSDLERKALFGAEPTDRLGPDGYSRAATEQTYDAVLQKAGLGLAAGHSVVVDAVFGRPDERAALEQLAARHGAGFAAVWLTAPADVLGTRVAARRDDASDATIDVLARQLERDAGAIGWPEVDAGGNADATLARARDVLGTPAA